jgi:hypothetical protein
VADEQRVLPQLPADGEDRPDPADQTILMYKPARWVEYGLQYYRNNHVRGVFSAEELTNAIRNEPRVLCIADDKALAETKDVTP